MKYPDWQKRFWQVLESKREATFAYGTHDCVLFAASMADAISDADYMERAREAFSWSNAREALVLTHGKDLQSLIESVMGPMQRWQYMSMGDMVLICDEADQKSLCVHDGCKLLGPDAVGFKEVPMRYAVGGWKVI